MIARFLLRSFILIFGVLMFNSCTEDENPMPPVEEPFNFMPITLDLAGLDVDMQTTTFSVQDYNFSVFNGDSVGSPDTDSFENGIGIAGPATDGDRSNLALDLSKVSSEIKAITVAMFNNCKCTEVEALDSTGSVLQKFDGRNSIPFGPYEVVIENTDKSIATVRITSLEAIVRSISLK